MKQYCRNPLSCRNITINAYLVPLQADVRAQTLALCRDADVDILSHVYFAEHWVEEDHTYENYKALMKDASEYGLPVLTMDIALQHCLNLTDSQVAELAKSYAELPGFGGYFVVDEPINPNIYARIENALRTVTPNAHVNVNFLPRGCYPAGDYIRQLTDYGSLLRHGGWLSLDDYSFSIGGGVNEYDLFTNYNDLRVAGLRTGCNTAVYVQSIGMENGYRRPSGSDLRYNMMAAVAYGIKELKFFCWGTPPDEEGPYSEAILGRDYKPTDLYEPVCCINKKIHALGKTLAGCDAVEVYHSCIKTENAYECIPETLFVQTNREANIIVSLMKEREGDREYLTVVNKDILQAQTFTLTFAGIDSVSCLDDFTGEPMARQLDNGSLTLTLDAGDATVICLPAGKRFPTDFVTPQTLNVNLALGKPVTASSSEGTGGYYLWNLTDGKTDGNGARVTSSDGSDQWLLVDLGQLTAFNRIDVYPSGSGQTCGAENPHSFTVSVSENGADWSDIYAMKDGTMSKTQVTVIAFDTVHARYVRVTVHGLNGVIQSAALGELAVYLDYGSMEREIRTAFSSNPFATEDNIALKKPVVAWSSTTDVPDWMCHHDYLVDGDGKTAWASGLHRHPTPDGEEWIVIDLCDTYLINRVVLTPRDENGGYNAFPERYEIAVSVNGQMFTTVKSVVEEAPVRSQEKRILTFCDVAARYVMFKATRLTFDPADGMYMVEMSEMEVYASEKIST